MPDRVVSQLPPARRGGYRPPHAVVCPERYHPPLPSLSFSLFSLLFFLSPFFRCPGPPSPTIRHDEGRRRSPPPVRHPTCRGEKPTGAHLPPVLFSPPPSAALSRRPPLPRGPRALTMGDQRDAGRLRRRRARTSTTAAPATAIAAATAAAVLVVVVTALGGWGGGGGGGNGGGGSGHCGGGDRRGGGGAGEAARKGGRQCRWRRH